MTQGRKKRLELITEEFDSEVAGRVSKSKYRLWGIGRFKTIHVTGTGIHSEARVLEDAADKLISRYGGIRHLGSQDGAGILKRPQERSFTFKLKNFTKKK